MQYFDKNGAEIQAGMFLLMEDGAVEKVYATSDQEGNPDLGVNASNEAFLRRHYPDCGDSYREYYPLSAFNWRKADICQPELSNAPSGNQHMTLGS